MARLVRKVSAQHKDEEYPVRCREKSSELPGDCATWKGLLRFCLDFLKEYCSVRFQSAGTHQHRCAG